MPKSTLTVRNVHEKVAMQANKKNSKSIISGKLQLFVGCERYLLAVSLLFVASGCSLEASILKEEILPVKNIEFIQANQTELLHGEVVTVYAGSRGYQIRAVFGELAEETPSINGSPWVLEGVFYE